MSSRARQGAGGVGLLMVLCLLLTGCTVLASDPTVRPGLSVSRADLERDLQVEPVGPRPSAEPTEILRGFVNALAGSSGDFATAREFLTAPAADTWSPESRTLVFRGSPQITPIDPVDVTDSETADDPSDESSEGASTPDEADEVVLRLGASTWAEVGRGGHFRELPVEELRTSEVVLARVSGQWRIRDLDPDFGRWLGTADFDRLYDSYAVHYAARDEQLLIPDIRYVPTDRVATRLAQLQLEAPPGYLVGAVRNDIPTSARLNVGAVPVVDGVATVDLMGEGIGADPESRARIWAQFVATLTQVRGVDRVVLTLDGVPLEIPGIESVRSLDDLGYVRPPAASRAGPLLRQGVDVVEFIPRAQVGDAPTTPAPLEPGPFPPIEEEWRDLALSAEGTELAGVSGDMMSRWRDGFRYEVPGFATDLGRPCYDRHDTLWVGGRGLAQASDRLFTVDAAASPADPASSGAVAVRVPWLSERRVLACAVSPQGTRIAIISDAGADTASRIDIGAVHRPDPGQPVAVFGPQVIGEHFASVADVVWLSETTMAMLGQTRANAALAVEMADNTDPVGASASGDESGGARGTLPYLVTVGGRTTGLPALPGGARITSTAGERNLIVSGDVVYVRVGSQWLPAQDQGDEVLVGTR